MRNIKILLFCLLTFFVFIPQPVEASHSWGTYHWARTSNPFTLKVADNLSSNWDSYLQTSASDWSTSVVLDLNIIAGTANPRRCQPTSGRVEVCNSKYGSNNWLGIAQIWVSGDHITQGVTKVNDTYFNTVKYNTAAWKNLVMCQELGHTFGLDHQDENFSNSNLGTCMDYTNDPSTNQHPNAHDYDQLEAIYAHLDAFSSLQSSLQKKPLGVAVSNSVKSESFDNRSDWGKEMKNNGHVAVFERDFGRGQKLFTFVIWAQE